MSSLFLLGLFVGLMFMYPAYLYGRIAGIDWATKQTRKALQEFMDE